MSTYVVVFDPDRGNNKSVGSVRVRQFDTTSTAARNVYDGDLCIFRDYGLPGMTLTAIVSYDHVRLVKTPLPETVLASLPGRRLHELLDERLFRPGSKAGEAVISRCSNEEDPRNDGHVNTDRRIEYRLDAQVHWMHPKSLAALQLP